MNSYVQRTFFKDDVVVETSIVEEVPYYPNSEFPRPWGDRDELYNELAVVGASTFGSNQRIQLRPVIRAGFSLTGAADRIKFNENVANLFTLGESDVRGVRADRVQLLFRAYSDDVITMSQVQAFRATDMIPPDDPGVFDLGGNYGSLDDNGTTTYYYEHLYELRFNQLAAEPLLFVLVSGDEGWLIREGIINLHRISVFPFRAIGPRVTPPLARLYAVHSLALASFGTFADATSNQLDWSVQYLWALGKLVQSEPGAMPSDPPYVGVLDVLKEKVQIVEMQRRSRPDDSWSGVYAALSVALAKMVDFGESGRNSTDFNYHFGWATARLQQGRLDEVGAELIAKYEFAFLMPSVLGPFAFKTPVFIAQRRALLKDGQRLRIVGALEVEVLSDDLHALRLARLSQASFRQQDAVL